MPDYMAKIDIEHNQYDFLQNIWDLPPVWVSETEKFSASIPWPFKKVQATFKVLKAITNSWKYHFLIYLAVPKDKRVQSTRNLA